MGDSNALQISSPVGPDLTDFESRNTKAFKCPLCHQAVLPKGEAVLSQKEFSLPTEASLAENAGNAGEALSWYWVVDDMWKFDNIGFTRPIPDANGKAQNFKFVICGCCDKGIMGIQFSDTGDNNIYIGHNRVTYH